MKAYLTTIFSLLLYTALCSAQTTDKQKNNALSFELGKSGLIYNLNYDHKFQAKNFGFRFGAGSNLAKYLFAFTFGGGCYYLAGNRSRFLELGADLNYLLVYEVSEDQRGFAFVYPNYAIKTNYASLNLGYRKYRRSSLFRIGVSPGFTKKGFIPGGYISYGVIF